MTTETVTQPGANGATQTPEGTGAGIDERSFLNELLGEPPATQAPEGTEATGAGTEATDGESSPLDSLFEEISDKRAEAKAADQVAQKAATDAAEAAKGRRKNEEEGITRAYHHFAPSMRQLLATKSQAARVVWDKYQKGDTPSEDELWQAFVTTADVNEVLNGFTSLHGTALGASAAQIFDAVAEHFIPGDEETAGKAKSRDWRYPRSDDEAVAYLNGIKEAVVNEARKGYVTEAAAKKREADAQAAVIRKLSEKNGAGARALLSKLNGIPEGLGVGATIPLTGELTPEQAATLPLDQLRAIRARQRG